MPKRIVIHAGFHKTGTTSIQKTLRENKGLLLPEIRIVLRDEMLGMCESARAYSQSKSALDLGMVQFETADTLQKFAEFDGILLLSSEDLSGHMPGRRGLTTYDAMPVIMQAIVGAAHEVFPDVELSLVFGIRTAETWLSSCYAQHLRATRLTQTAQEYAGDYSGSADLEGVISSLAEALPNTEIVTMPLEACGGLLLGPTDLLLDHLEVAQTVRHGFTILPPANISPPQKKLDKLLELNRSSLYDADLKKAKRALNAQKFAVD